jgi:hypothetical protein
VPIIDREDFDGWAHCSQQVDEHGQLAYDAQGVPAGLDRCPGYAQVKVRAVRETVQFTYGDAHQSPGSDPMDSMVARMVEHSVERLLWSNPADEPCPYCGAPRVLTDQVRPVYQSLGGARGGPDQLFADRRARRQQVQAQQTAASAAERSAAALERLADEGNSENVELAALRSEIADLRAQISNGHDEPEPDPTRPSDIAPRPRKQRSRA